MPSAIIDPPRISVTRVKLALRLHEGSPMAERSCDRDRRLKGEKK